MPEKVIVIPLDAFSFSFRTALKIHEPRATGVAVELFDAPACFQPLASSQIGTMTKWQGFMFRVYALDDMIAIQAIDTQHDWKLSWWKVVSTIRVVNEDTQPGDSHGNKVAAQES